jgi:hypothetical protein
VSISRISYAGNSPDGSIHAWSVTTTCDNGNSLQKSSSSYKYLRFAFRYISVVDKSLTVLEALVSQVFNIQSFLK